MDNNQQEISTAPTCPSSVKWGSWIIFVFSAVGLVLMAMALPSTAGTKIAPLILATLAELLLRMVLSILTMMGRLVAYCGLLVMIAFGLVMTAIASQGQTTPFNGTLMVIAFALLIARYNDYIAFASWQQNINKPTT